MKTSLFLGTALAALLVTGMASAAKKSYTVDVMEGKNEVPPVNTNVTADARFTYDDVTKQLCGHITILTVKDTVITAAHIHKGKAGANGDPAISFDGFTGELVVNQKLTADEEAALTGGETYVNLHTKANGNGEVRDQLVEDGDESKPDEDCGGGGDSDAGATGSDAGKTTTTPSTSSSSGDAGKSSTTATPDDTSGGCNTTGSSGTGTGLGIAAGLGLALAALSRKRKKA